MYAVSKTALLGLTKGLAAELGPDGITVNCVAPGIVPTKFSAALVADKELVSALLLGLWGMCCGGFAVQGLFMCW
jgi:dehydrogenase/reductase SDR family protein 4